MRFFGYIILVLIGVVIGTYCPATTYLPPKETVMDTVRNNAPFLADWLPEADEAEPEEEEDSSDDEEADSTIEPDGEDVQDPTESE